ncbi:DUF294 nucleotidyltransferase-like domain-containing protein [Vibrio toranzoniae]|uniref:DUF294 nucleotidyltransferase-like domain-containing protein n=1 Tax=Vibrio toranzoniae TaxID=1194427 RepID=UPI0013783A47|nr:DUF294 nucleotidyltransferase-like domain-containing protein [Vibrio toranzoniae]NAZ71664.1 CBS domain-containing protein [Vibrio toranzoniae]
MDSTLLPNIVSFLKTIDPFSQLPNTIVTNIASNTEILYIGNGDVLATKKNSDQYLYVVRSGILEQHLPNGKLRAKIGSHDLFGFNLEKENYQITAVENSLIYRFPLSTLQAQVQDFPSVADQLASKANQRLYSCVKVRWSESEKGLFFKPIKDVADSNVAIVNASDSIQNVAKIMRHEIGSSCAVIMEENSLIGLITDKDMTKRVVAEGVNTTLPIKTVMTTSPHTIKDDDLVLSAVNLMMTKNIQHIPVMNQDHQVVGVITPQSLVKKHSVQAVFLIKKIDKVKDIEELTPLASERQAIFEAMAEAHLPSVVISQVLTMIYDAFTTKLITLAEKIIGPAPCKYAFLAAGSHARNEIHLGSDQDNAIVLENSASDSDRIYFRHLAMYVCKGLAECGYSLCNGRFMAATPKWNQPLSIWKQYYRKWSNSPEYDKLLNLTVFLEIRLLAGEQTLFDELDTFRHEQVTANARLMSALVRNALKNSPPLGIFNNLVLEKNGDNGKTLDIKKAAIGPLVDLARIYAVSEGGDILSTEERLNFILDKEVMNKNSIEDLVGTYRYVTQLRYTHHLHQLRDNKDITNSIMPNNFGSFERQHLKDAFQIINSYQDAMKMKFGY